MGDETSQIWRAGPQMTAYFADEMWEALEADGEKLRQLTGEDHGPVFIGEDLYPGQAPCPASSPPPTHGWRAI